MELPNQQGDMPIPLNSTYGGHGHGHGHGHMIHHDPHNNHIIPSSASSMPGQIPSNNGGPPICSPLDHDHAPPSFKKVVVLKYKECLKNHAAAMGGNATDGCGEFMPSGEDGTLEALTCSACSCHRNFHRKEAEGEPLMFPYENNNNYSRTVGRKLFLQGGHHHKGGYLAGQDAALGYHAGTLISSRTVAPHQMIMSYNMGGGGGGCLASESDEQEEGGVVGGRQHHQLVKKRFRTKFSQEQKEKMHSFAEKVGWKIQKQEEATVQQFCQEIGVKRRVLKVWMHNNKHNLAKKTHQSNPNENHVLDTDS